MMSSKLENRAEKIAVTIDGKEYVIKNRYGTADDVMYLEDMINGELITVREHKKGAQQVSLENKRRREIERFDLDNTGQYWCRIRREFDEHPLPWIFEMFQEGQINCVERINLSEIIYKREKEALKGMYQNGSDIPIELFKHMTVNQFREMFDEFDKEKENMEGKDISRRSTMDATMDEIKKIYRAGECVPLELLKDMTCNQFSNMMNELDELDKERNNDEDA